MSTLKCVLILISFAQVENGIADLCSPESASAETGIAAANTPHRIHAQHLPNAVRVHANVISGGLPQGNEAFQELQSLGVKTVISVDGQKPDVRTAAKYGLRYVHLPHGYDGVPLSRVMELAKAVQELDGPIYIHCHHGKHRSPTAATVACVALGLLPRAQAVPVLRLAGASPKYRGLFQSARAAKPLDKALLDGLKVEFREEIDVPPLADAMVKMEHTHEHLTKIALARWRTPTEHPDLDPAHEALLLREHFTELLRADYVRQEPEAFKALLRNSEDAAKALEFALRDWTPATPSAEPPEVVLRLSARIAANCTACHERFRDIPISEKRPRP